MTKLVGYVPFPSIEQPDHKSSNSVPKSRDCGLSSVQKSDLLGGRVVNNAKNQPSKGCYALAIVIGILVMSMGILNMSWLKSVCDFSWICPSLLGGASLIVWASCKIDSIRLVEKKLLSQKKTNQIDDFSMDGGSDNKKLLLLNTSPSQVNPQQEVSPDQKLQLLNQWFAPNGIMPDKDSYQLTPIKYQDNVDTIPAGQCVCGVIGTWYKGKFQPRKEPYRYFLILKREDGQRLLSKKMTIHIRDSLIKQLGLQMA